MKYLKILLLLISPLFATAQPLGTWPVQYGDTPPTHTPSGLGTRIYLNISTNELYNWNPAPASSWVKYPKGFDQISGCSAPGYTPTARQSVFAVNSCTVLQNGKGPELYYYTGSTWLQINEGQTYEAGSGISIAGNTITNSAPAQYTDISTLGAIGDGITDNTAIVRSALMQNRVIYVPSGVFVCDSLMVPEGRMILGAGENSVLLFKSASTGRFIDCRNGNVTLQNIVVSGNESASTYASASSAGSRIGIYIKGDNNTTKIVNSWVRGFDLSGIGGNGSSSNREKTPVISGVSITNCFVGINTNQGAGNGCEYLRIEGCNVAGCRVGVDINSGNALLTGNTISDNGYGIIVKNGGTGGNAGHGTITGNLINHSSITGLVMLSTPFGYVVSGNNIYYGGVDITGDGVMVTGNVFGFQSGDSLMLRNGNECFFKENYIASSFAYTSLIGSAWVYSDNKSVSGSYVGGLFRPVFNGNASYNLSTNTLTAPNIISTTNLFNQVGAASNMLGYVRTSNAAASTTQLNPGLAVYLTGGGSPHGIDLGYSNSRYRTRLFTNNDISFARATSSPTQQSDFTDIMTVRGDNDRVGIGTQSPGEKLDVVGNIQASGNLIGAGLNVSGDVVFGGRVTAVNFRQSAGAAGNITNYLRTNANAASTTTLNPGIILYESGGNFVHGLDLGYSNSRFRTRLFTNNDISFAYAASTVDDQTDFADIMTIRGDSKTVGIGTQGPDQSALLEVASTTKGFLPPRMTSSQKGAISSPATGLTIYCTDCIATDSSTGVMQTYNGSAWKNNW